MAVERDAFTDAGNDLPDTFIRCILENKIPLVTGIDRRIPVVMGYAAKKSYAEKRPVKLSEVNIK